MKRAIMTDPEQLRSLEGQQYVVLCPTGPVAAFFDATQEELRAAVPMAPFPTVGHVTLRGFSEARRVGELRNEIRAWAAGIPPIELQVDAVDAFPAPFQIVITRLARTASLVDAYSSLTDRLGATDFSRVGELPLEQWVFHLSLIYGAALSAEEWETLRRGAVRDIPSGPSETVASVEFVWFEGGAEHSETITLGG
ncbi:2'-5' RNA ligase family protein [Microbacterium barkeri]|uniref:2'-5' RNA ligase family protein n=1 Tax=Microbacterium barkeri TaxID=33917 RepID=UPI0024AF0AA5|nr:2'-5' RNA ligase family protein [Microbacterium barkeri]MDI6944414.1 2'-5' RNA ligase family protein [Microbacterium barkeri]